MKKLIQKIESRLWMFLVGICTLLTYTGCNEDDMPFIALDNEVIVLDTDMHKESVDVKANVEWTATSDVDWCKVIKGNGAYKGGFELIVDANDTPDKRTATITVSGGGCMATLLVQQNAADLTLSVSEENVHFGMAADKYTVLVVSNNEWSVVSSSDWCKAAKVEGSDKGELEISVSENTTGKRREAVVSVVSNVGNNKTVKNIKVVQDIDEHVLELASENYSVDKKAQDIMIPLVVAGKPYTLSVAADAKWLTPSVEGEKNVKVAVSENNTGVKRSATVTVTMAGFPGNPIVRKLKVSQDAHINELNIPVEEAKLVPTGGKMELAFSANGAIELKCSASWFKASIIKSEKGSDVIGIEYEPNYSEKAREGFLTAILKNNEGKEVTRTVKLTQDFTEGFKLNVQSEKYLVDRQKQDLIVPLIVKGTPFKLDVASDSPWLTVKKNEDDTEVAASVAENTTGEERSAVITITMSEIPGDPIVRKVQIVQSALVNELSIPMQQAALEPNGGEMLIPFKSNGVPELKCSADWFSAEIFKEEVPQEEAEAKSRAAEVSDQIKVTFKPNYTEATREGFLTAVLRNGEGKEVSCTVKLTQDPSSGYKLEVKSDNYVVDKQANEMFEIPVLVAGPDKNYKLSVASNQNWIKNLVISDDHTKVQGVLTENNTGEERVATVTITMNGIPGDAIVRKVKVVQKAVINELSISIKEAILNPNGGEISIPYIASSTPEWKLSENWAYVMDPTEQPRSVRTNVTDKGQVVMIGFGPNDTESTRECFLTGVIKNDEGKEVSCTVKLTQDPMNGFKLEVVSDNYVVDKNPNEKFEIPVVVEAPESGNYQISVASNQDWINNLSFNGETNMIQGTLLANNTGVERVATITITMSGMPGDPIVRKVQVVQQAVINELTISIKEAKLESNGGIIRIPYIASSTPEWKFSADWAREYKPTENKEPLSVRANESEKESVVEVEYDPNDTESTRECFMTGVIKNQEGKEVSCTVKLTQDPMSGFKLEVLSDYFEIDKKQQNVDIPVILLEGIGVEGADVTANANVDWIESVTPVEDEEQKVTKFVANVKANDTGVERTGVITISMSGMPGDPIVRKVTIVQKAEIKELTIPMSDLALQPQGGDVQIPFTAIGGQPKLKCSASWVKAMIVKSGQTKAAERDMINLYFEANETGSAREAVLTAIMENNEGKEVSCTVNLTQAPLQGYKLEVQSDRYVIEQNTKKFNCPLIVEFPKINVESSQHKDPEITAVADVDWLQNISVDEKAVKITNIKENQTGADRIGTVTITMSSIPGDPIVRTVQIVQKGKTDFLNVPVKNLVANPEGESFNISYSASQKNVTVSSTSGWIVPASSNGKITIKVQKNTSDAVREGAVVVSMNKQDGTTETATIQISQNAQSPYAFELLQDEFKKNDAAGNVKIAFKIDTKGKTNLTLDVVSDADWATAPQQPVTDFSNGFVNIHVKKLEASNQYGATPSRTANIKFILSDGQNSPYVVRMAKIVQVYE